jgi:sugar/nucleoside kinase (ribokinase family)
MLSHIAKKRSRAQDKLMKILLIILLLIGSAAFAESVVHLEGSLLENGVCLEKSMQMAKACGSKILFDLSNTKMVADYRERIFALLEAYTDVLILNEEEAFALTKLPPERSEQFLKNFCPSVIINQAEPH